MKAIKTLIVVIALAATGAANAAIIATYDFTNTGTITGQTYGTINETGTAVLDDIGGGQAVMTINKQGVTETLASGAFNTTTQIVYQGTLSSGIFAVGSGQRMELSCTSIVNNCSPSLTLGFWTTFTDYILGTDSGGLPMTATSLGISYDNLFHVADATETLLTREGRVAGQAIITNKMTFANTAVPIPAAAWLFGSGLLGLTGVARRRKPM